MIGNAKPLNPVCPSSPYPLSRSDVRAFGAALKAGRIPPEKAEAVLGELVEIASDPATPVNLFITILKVIFDADRLDLQARINRTRTK